MKILGLSCSLRNARFGVGSRNLVADIDKIESKEALKAYLQEQTKLRVEDFVDAGRGEGRPFDEIYRNLRAAKGDRGLSNSEACLVAALWGARRIGVDIEHCGLAPYFPMAGEPRKLDELRSRILEADGLLLSGPVYFGDRSSVAQEFIEFVRNDPEIATHLRDRLYAGIAVGAKRNGGQETTLIYQLVDMTNLNMLAVGNDSESTSQYGGTALAGDVGTAWKDDYGLDTSIGTGRRIARVAQSLERGSRNSLNDDLRVAVWLLQDAADGKGRSYIESLCAEIADRTSGVTFDIRTFTEDEILRCIACDVCPIEPGTPEEYRCIINAKRDLFKEHHTEITSADAILAAAYSPVRRDGIYSVYQRFVERTRYIRRDDYLIGDRLAAPFVISEINSNQNLHIRMLTSLVRHHTVLHHPLIGMERDGELLNRAFVIEQGISFVANARRLTAGRLAASEEEVKTIGYNPVGYEISREKLRQDTESGKTRESQDARSSAHDVARERLKA